MSHKPGVVLCALLSNQEVHLNGQTFSFVPRNANENIFGIFRKIKGRKRKWVKTEINLTEFIEMCEKVSDAEALHLIKENHYMAHGHEREHASIATIDD